VAKCVVVSEEEGDRDGDGDGEKVCVCVWGRLGDGDGDGAASSSSSSFIVPRFGLVYHAILVVCVSWRCYSQSKQNKFYHVADGLCVCIEQKREIYH
jgi:hypothetical protein